MYTNVGASYEITMRLQPALHVPIARFGSKISQLLITWLQASPTSSNSRGGDDCSPRFCSWSCQWRLFVMKTFLKSSEFWLLLSFSNNGLSQVFVLRKQHSLLLKFLGQASDFSLRICDNSVAFYLTSWEWPACCRSSKSPPIRLVFGTLMT